MQIPKSLSYHLPLLELRAGDHSQLKVVTKTASFYAYAVIFYAAIFSMHKNFMLIFYGWAAFTHPVFLIKS